MVYVKKQSRIKHAGIDFSNYELVRQIERLQFDGSLDSVRYEDVIYLVVSRKTKKRNEADGRLGYNSIGGLSRDCAVNINPNWDLDTKRRLLFEEILAIAAVRKHISKGKGEGLEEVAAGARLSARKYWEGNHSN